jgi:hypothetical protein
MSQQIPVTPWELCYDSRLDDAEMDAIFSEFESQEEQTEANKEFDEDLLKEEELDEVYD